MCIVCRRGSLCLLLAELDSKPVGWVTILAEAEARRVGME